MEKAFKLACPNGHGEEWNIFSPDVIPPFKCKACSGSMFLDSIDTAWMKKTNFKQISFWDLIESIFPRIITEQSISLGEGTTPLVPARASITSKHGKVLFKDESQNPTKSYRDRAAAILVSIAILQEKKQINVATTGNMGASICAYSASAGIQTNVFSKRNIDIGKISQIITYGGIMKSIYKDNGEAIEASMDFPPQGDVYQATAELNPISMHVQKTIAYEIFGEIGVPDEIFISSGNGGTLFSIWQGFNDLLEAGIIERVPRMIGAVIVQDASSKIFPLEEASKYSQRDLMHHAIQQSKGDILRVDDGEVGEAISILARNEGLFVEPAAAAAYAALLKQEDVDGVGRKEKVVILTGTGLKAPSVIEAITRKETWHVGSIFPSKLNLRFHILEQLDKIGEPGLHGYGIFLNIKKEVKCSKQAIYHHLKQLEEKNFISSMEKDAQGKVLFKITENGKEVLDLLKKLVSLI